MEIVNAHATTRTARINFFMRLSFGRGSPGMVPQILSVKSNSVMPSRTAILATGWSSTQRAEKVRVYSRQRVWPGIGNFRRHGWGRNLRFEYHYRPSAEILPPEVPHSYSANSGCIFASDPKIHCRSFVEILQR